MANDDTREPDLDDMAAESPDVAHEKLRRNIAARLTRLITTEEGLRTVIGAVVPKELIASTIDQVDATKTEAMAMVGRELRTFLDHLDVGEELAKILTAVSFEIRLEVRFVPNEDGTLRAKVRGGAKPKVDIEPRRKPWQRKATDGDDEADPAGASPRDSAGEREDEAEAAPPAPTPRPGRAHTSSSPEPWPAASASIASGGDAASDEPERRLRDRLGRRSFTNMVERVADAAATTARVAAEVAADAAAEVVNEARRNRDGDDDGFDDY